MKIFKLIILLSFFSFSLCNIEKYLKLPNDKTAYLKNAVENNFNTKIEKIDFIYVINLDERPEKWDLTLKQLEKYNIFPYRFSAVNGWKLPLKTLNSVGVKFKNNMRGGFMGTSYKDDNLKPIHELIRNEGQVYFSHCMARGAIGIVLSHLSVLKDALNSGYNRIWVMEDDIELVKDPHEISKVVKKLDEQVGENNWDILFTDRDTRDSKGNYVPAGGIVKIPNFDPINKDQYYMRKQISEDFIQVGARFGAYSMIINKSGMKKILNFVKKYKIFLPYDLTNYLPEGIKLYAVANDIVRHTLKFISDNGGENYLKKNNKKN